MPRKSQLKKHFNDTRVLILKHVNTLKDKLEGEISSVYIDIMEKSMTKLKSKIKIIKNKKQDNFQLKRKNSNKKMFFIKLMKLSNYQLSEKQYDRHCL